jgi:hypothetical protein
MQDLTKNTNAKTIDTKLPESAKQSRWLTKNRFWNLAFLFLVPIQIFIAALFWSGWFLLLPLATTVAIFKYVPTDLGTLTPEQARQDPFAKAACGIFFASLVAFFFAGNKILSLFGLQLGQFSFAESVFIIFLIPISILCYANIPLSSCVEAKDPKDITSMGFRSSVGDSRVPYSIRSQNWKH